MTRPGCPWTYEEFPPLPSTNFPILLPSLLVLIQSGVYYSFTPLGPQFTPDPKSRCIIPRIKPTPVKPND